MIAADIEQKIRQWAGRIVAIDGDPEDGHEPKTGYCRVYAGKSWRSKGSPRVSGIAWAAGDDPRELAATLVRHVSGIDEPCKVWIEAVIRGESSACDTLPLSVEGNGHELDVETDRPGDGVYRALIESNRMLQSLAAGAMTTVHELYRDSLATQRQIGAFEGYSEAAGQENGQAMLASALSELTPHLGPAIQLFAQGYAQQSAANAQSAPSGHESQADEPAPEPATPEQAAMAHADRLEAEVESLVSLVMRSPSALTDAVRARLAALLDQLDMARPFIVGGAA